MSEEKIPRVIEVIVSHQKRGSGLTAGQIKYKNALLEHKLLEDDSVRNVIQYHTLDGTFLAEVDWRTEMIMKKFNKKEDENK